MKSGRFHAVKPEALRVNPFQAIGQDWMLVTAGTPDHFNTMTASWGAMGVLWGKPIAICFVRPSRYTFGFLEACERFSLSFFDEAHRAALDFCGTHSGRGVDKVAATGLTPMPTPAGAMAFEQARLVLSCRKIYTQDIEPARIGDPSVLSNYEQSDYHRMFVGELVECLVAGGAP